jgi:hypothetical protein
MPSHDHTHRHHHPGQGHPAAAVLPSMLRLSVLQRLGAAGLAITLIWVTVLWAIA